MNFAEKYMNDSFLHAPEGVAGGEGGASPTANAPAGTSNTGTIDPGSSGDGGAPPAPSPAEGSAADDFSGFDDDLDSVDLGAETSPSPEAPQAQPTPTPQAAQSPAVAAPKVEEPVAPVAAEPKETASPPSELDNLVQSVDANQPALIDWLAKNAFALSKEEAEAFELDAVGNVPRLMARVAVNNMKSTMNTIKSLVPQMIAAEVAKITSTQSKAKEAIGEFYSANPHLNEKDHGAIVTKWANAYRAANPKASRKEAIEYVGRAASFEAGLVPGQPAAAQRPAPFAPARPGARQPVVTGNENPSPFAGLGGEFDEE